MSPTRSRDAKLRATPHYRARAACNRKLRLHLRLWHARTGQYTLTLAYLPFPGTHGTNTMKPEKGPFDRTRPHGYARVPIDATPEDAVAITGIPYGVTNAPPQEVQQPRTKTKRKRTAAESRSRTLKSPAKISHRMPVQPRQTRSKTQAAGPSGSPRSSPHTDSGSLKSASRFDHGSRTRSLVAKLRLPSSVLKKLRGSGSHPRGNGEICNPTTDAPLTTAPPQTAFADFGLTALPSNALHTSPDATYPHGQRLKVRSPIMVHTPEQEIVRHDPRFFLSMQGQDVFTPPNQPLLLQQPWAFSQPPVTPPYMREYLPGSQVFPINYSPEYTTMNYDHRFSAPPAGQMTGMESHATNISNGGAIPMIRGQSAPARCYQYGNALPPVYPHAMANSTANFMNAQTSHVPNDIFTPLIQSELVNDGIFIHTGWCLNMVAIQDTRTIFNVRDGTVKIVVTGKANGLGGSGQCAQGHGMGME